MTAEANTKTTPAQCAAKWWADQLRAPTTLNDNGDRSAVGFLGMGLSELVKRQQLSKLKPEHVDAFEVALRDGVQQELDDSAAFKLQHGYGRDHVCINVDYGPGHELQKAMSAAGIDYAALSTAFPIKTVMWVYAHRVDLRCGYRAETRRFWTSDDACRTCDATGRVRCPKACTYVYEGPRCETCTDYGTIPCSACNGSGVSRKVAGDE